MLLQEAEREEDLELTCEREVSIFKILYTKKFMMLYALACFHMF